MISKWEEVDSLWHRMYKNGRASEKVSIYITYCHIFHRTSENQPFRCEPVV
ncbi:unnamed protein product [Schistosoma curassoni]|uniref:Ovule protein n=1 Tax=Schistosoma curassoni TaxID=6186 RepID=A0A183L3I0_9TREM|nr:unnamed protein product [Schistosoma curassoni]